MRALFEFDDADGKTYTDSLTIEDNDETIWFCIEHDSGYGRSASLSMPRSELSRLREFVNSLPDLT